MPGDRHERDGAARRNGFGDTFRREAERRLAIRERARELKRALMQSTMLLTGRRQAVVDKVVHKARRRRRGGSALLNYCVVLFSGAFSMLIPFPSTCSLHGQVLDAAQDEATSGVLPHAVVFAQPAQCALLGYEEPGSASLDAPEQEGAVFEARITRLVPHAAAANAASTCQIELELQATQDLPPGTALNVQLQAQPRSWLAVLIDHAAGDGTLSQGSRALPGHMTHALAYAQAQVIHIARDTEVGRAIAASVADVWKSEADEETP